ncbi:MAG: hypothetical protein ACREX4_17220 [Gammaproteobacteria bacterium]
MTDEHPDYANVIALPPLVYLTFFALGVGPGPRVAACTLGQRATVSAGLRTGRERRAPHRKS